MACTLVGVRFEHLRALLLWAAEFLVLSIESDDQFCGSAGIGVQCPSL